VARPGFESGNPDMKGGIMAGKLRPSSGAVCLVVAVSVGVICGSSRSAVGQDDHSYLPPWMINESGEVRKADEIAEPPRVPRARDVQPARAEAQLVKTNELSVPGLTAKATQVKTKVVGFVSNVFQRSLRLASGE
jgi:hypothetical protein